MTHELKTPIASIKLYLETVKTRELSEEKRREFYDVMLSDSDRLLNTVEQVLQASRTREKKRELNYSDVNISKLIDDSVRVIRSRYNLVKDEIVVGDFDEGLVVEGDLSELKTAFGNLLDNAVKYSNGEINISVRSRVRTGGWIDVYIKDSGYGIPATEIGRVF